MTPTKFQHAGLDWIPHTPGDPMPCPSDTLVRVLLSCEKENGVYYDDVDSAEIWNWADAGHRSIIGWHPVEEQPSQKQLLSLALRALCLTRDYVGEGLLPAIKGWDWFDAGCKIASAIPDDEWTREFHLRVQSCRTSKTKHELRKELE